MARSSNHKSPVGWHTDRPCLQKVQRVRFVPKAGGDGGQRHVKGGRGGAQIDL